jgi:hypothetical protein
MPDIYFVDELTPVNPFSAKGQYDDNWVELSITDSNEYQMMTGKTVIFSFKVSKRCEGWQLRAMDYVSFQLLNNTNVIISSSKNDYKEAESAYKGHSVFDQVVRPYEPEILIHSTSPDASFGMRFLWLQHRSSVFWRC